MIKRDPLEKEILKRLQTRLRAIMGFTCKELSDDNGYCSKVENNIKADIREAIIALRHEYDSELPPTFNMISFTGVNMNSGIVEYIKYNIKENTTYEDSIPIRIVAFISISDNKIAGYSISHDIVALKTVDSSRQGFLDDSDAAVESANC